MPTFIFLPRLVISSVISFSRRCMVAIVSDTLSSTNLE